MRYVWMASLAITMAMGSCLSVHGQSMCGPECLDSKQVQGIAAATSYQICEGHEAPCLLDLIELNERKPPWMIPQWGVDREVFDHLGNEPFLIEAARFCGSLGITDWYTDEQIMRASVMARKAAVGLTINHSPFHRVQLPDDAHICNPDPLDWSDTALEIAWTQRFLIRVLRLGVDVDAILFDSECYKEPHPFATDRMNTAYLLAKEFFPDVPFYWYRNGDWEPNLDNHNDDNRSLIWYRTYSQRSTELWMNRWEEKLTDSGRDVLPWAVWTTLGPGYRDDWQWELELDPLEYHALGRGLAADLRVDAVILYPGFYREKVPGFHDAFMAFGRGATDRPP